MLIGHSQGSLMLQQLIAREIENDPAVAARMKLAIIPGYRRAGAAGQAGRRDVQEDAAVQPSRPDQLRDDLDQLSRDATCRPEGAMFGYADRPGMTVGCVNPALPGSRDWVKLDSYWFARSSYPVAGGPIQWSTEGPPPTPYLRTEGLVSAKCVNDGQRGYLSVHTNADPNDKRTDRIGGEVGILGMFLPGWGMHLADIAIAQGDLVREVGEISARSRTAARPAGPSACGELQGQQGRRDEHADFRPY